MMCRTLVALLLGSMVATAANAQEADYLGDIKPVLQQRCYACHGAVKQESGLRLDTAQLMLQGGDSGPAVEPGQPDGSLLWQRISSEDPSERMPPEGAPLTPEQLTAVRRWIEAGTAAPADERPEVPPEEHWAFQVPQRPEIPAANSAWGRNPIDVFITARHQQLGLQPVSRASPEDLLRRVYLDLTGLPPTPEELDAFVANPSNEAYEAIVDRLLNSPQYGERWGRHWMDVWRYSDWYGRRAVPDVLNSYAQIWRWRDWIVASMNEDKGYDQMVLEMLAADEIAADKDGALPATGFLVRNFYRWNYHTWMKDNVEHTAKAFLALSLNCAQCHDHKYDPITQEEYFHFRAFFEPLELRQDRVPNEPDPGMYPKYVYGSAYAPITSGMIRVFDEKLDAQTFMYLRGDERNIVKDKPPIPPGVPAALGGGLHIAEIPLPPQAWYPGLKPFVRAEERTRHQDAVELGQNEWHAAQQRQQQQQDSLVAARAAAESALQQAIGQASASGQAVAALAGRRSLLLHAEQGRKVLAYRFASRPNNDVDVTFQIKLLADSHTNFQLALNVAQGATGGYVEFRQGKIYTYQPGTFQSLEVGSYNPGAGEDHFQVTMNVVPQENLFRLTVRRASDGFILVNGVPAALNGWNPAANAEHGLFIDARTGTVVLYDDITITPHAAGSSATIDFESDAYRDDQEVVGIEGWEDTTFSVAPGRSAASVAVMRDDVLATATLQRDIAVAALEELSLAVQAAEAKLHAAQAELASLEARIAADDARYLLQVPEPQAAIRAAVQAERAAKLAIAEHQVLEARHAVAAAQARPADDAQRGAELERTQPLVASAVQALDAARAGMTASEEGVEYAALSPKYPQTTTGRRAALARWIVAKENPLAARVAVNHIWLRHFGRGLVTTPDNFGRSGNPPSHPELLDWLAMELMENGWRMKHIHRLIVTSGAYQFASTVDPDHPNRAIDRDNVYLWRYVPQRLETEAIRDSMLYVAGEVDLHIGGREIEQSEAAQSRRRSLYISHHGETKFELLDLFDAANPSDCYQRTSSVRPQQALALMNSDLAAALGRSLAWRVWNDIQGAGLTAEGAESQFVEALFKRTLSRSPTAEEQATCLAFLTQQTELLAKKLDLAGTTSAPAVGRAPSTDPAQRAREGLAQALFSHSDFITIR